MNALDVQQLTFDKSVVYRSHESKERSKAAASTTSGNRAVGPRALITVAHTLLVVDHCEHSIDEGARACNSKSGRAGRAVLTVMCTIDIHERRDQSGEGVYKSCEEEVGEEPFGVIRPVIPEPADCACIGEATDVTDRKSIG